MISLEGLNDFHGFDFANEKSYLNSGASTFYTIYLKTNRSGKIVFKTIIKKNNW